MEQLVSDAASLHSKFLWVSLSSLVSTCMLEEQGIMCQYYWLRMFILCCLFCVTVQKVFKTLLLLHRNTEFYGLRTCVFETSVGATIKKAVTVDLLVTQIEGKP